MTMTDDSLERELKKLYAHVPPPPGGLLTDAPRKDGFYAVTPLTFRLNSKIIFSA